jgi:hypothetical protein
MAGFAEQAQVSPKYYKPFDERQEVADSVARNSIPRKYARMQVVTLSDQITWRLKACPAGQTLAGGWGSDDSQWDEADVSATAAGSVDNSQLATDVKVGSLAGLRTAWGAVANGFSAVQDFLANLLSRTAALETKTANLSGTNTGDQDISGIATNAAAISQHVADHANPHGVTASQVGLGSVTNDPQVKRTEMGVASGVATLDTGGKVPFAQLPDAVLGQVHYKGTYLFGANQITSADSTLNGAALPAAAAANVGWYFIVQDSGVLNTKVFNTGDWLISNGAAGWDKVDNTDQVSSVAGRQGAVVLTTDDVPEKATNPLYQYFTEGRVRNVVMTGYQKSATNRAVAATDTMPVAIGVVEKKVDDNTNAIATITSAFSYVVPFSLTYISPDCFRRAAKFTALTIGEGLSSITLMVNGASTTYTATQLAAITSANPLVIQAGSNLRWQAAGYLAGFNFGTLTVEGIYL